MPTFKDKFRNINKSHLLLAGVLLLLLFAVGLLWHNRSTSKQAINATPASVYFDGEYRIGDGEWQPIEAGKHIPASQGDVTLRGNFHTLKPNGEYIGLFSGGVPLAFYTNHISLTFVKGDRSYTIDHENPLCGDSACGQAWTSHYFEPGNTDPIEIIVHNPHLYGNETAIDEMLENFAIWGNIDFEKGVLKSGETQRNLGILLVLVSLVFLGTALFSSLIHIKNSSIIWQTGIVVLFAGMYFAYSAKGVSFWSESVISNTTLLGFSMMFYMFFLCMSIVYFLNNTKRIGQIAMVCLGVSNAVFFVLPMISEVYFYDTWLWWTIVQNVADVVLAVCLIMEYIRGKTKARWLYLGALLPLISFGVDVVGTWRGAWNGGLTSKYLFIILLAVAAVLVLKLIPNSINATTKARER